MHVAYAAIVAAVLCVGETLRHGVFGHGSSDVSLVALGAFALGGLVLMRADLASLIRRPRGALYGRADSGWTGARTGLGVVLSPLILGVYLVAMTVPGGMAPSAVLAGLGAAWTGLSFDPGLLAEAFLAGLVIALFFIETAYKSCGGRRAATMVLSLLSVFAFGLSISLQVAIAAVGLGIWALTLRFVGVNVLVLAVTLIVARLAVEPGALPLPADLLQAVLWLGGSAALSAIVWLGLGAPESDLRGAVVRRPALRAPTGQGVSHA